MYVMYMQKMFKSLTNVAKNGEIYCSCCFIIKVDDKKWNWKWCMHGNDILWGMVLEVPFELSLQFGVQ